MTNQSNQTDAPALNIMECRHCGAAFWFAWPDGGAVDGCPGCFGHALLDIDSYPTERAALKAYPAWEQSRDFHHEGREGKEVRA